MGKSVSAARIHVAVLTIQAISRIVRDRIGSQVNCAESFLVQFLDRVKVNGVRSSLLESEHRVEQYLMLP